jgi:hypothetical protein
MTRMEDQSELTDMHGGTAALHVSELAAASHGEAKRVVRRLCEVEADPTLVKRRRKRHGGMVVHASRGGALVSREGMAEYSPHLDEGGCERAQSMRGVEAKPRARRLEGGCGGFGARHRRTSRRPSATVAATCSGERRRRRNEREQGRRTREAG